MTLKLSNLESYKILKTFQSGDEIYIGDWEVDENEDEGDGDICTECNKEGVINLVIDMYLRVIQMIF